MLFGMSGPIGDCARPQNEALQAPHAIYAWTKLLQQAVSLDETERARALAIIELNGRLLLRRLVSS